MRYEIRLGSQSCHCCFQATVVDTSRPVLIHGKQYSDSSGLCWEPVCECLNTEDALEICRALNERDALVNRCAEVAEQEPCAVVEAKR